MWSNLGSKATSANESAIEMHKNRSVGHELEIFRLLDPEQATHPTCPTVEVDD